jgi:hypothetical protein
MPRLEEMSRPVWSTARRAGMLTLRGYLFIAAVLVVARIVQLTLAGGGHS